MEAPNRHLILRASLLTQLLGALFAVWAAGAAADQGTGPHETVDQTFTTTVPGSPTGGSFNASYHAANDPSGNPPAMRGMVVHPPPGMRYDTSVPDRCSASDLVLQVRGPAACPAGSRIGEGTVEGVMMEPFAHDFVFDHFTHHVYLLNNTNEQIILVHSEGYLVVRGQMSADGSISWHNPTCFPVPPVAGCVDDYLIQLRTSVVTPLYTRTSGGVVRSYMTTPPTCPAVGYWSTTADFSWVDGSSDSVVTTQPCSSPG
jgi:hypothetical protein